MLIPESLILDFSSSDIKDKITKLLANCKQEDWLYSALDFSHDWFIGKTEFSFSTSGSTGKPETILVSKERVIASVEATNWFLKLKKEDKIFICLNAKYTGGKMMFARAIHLGLKAYVVKPSSDFYNYVGNEAFAFTALVPSQLFVLFQQPNFKDILSYFKTILVGGAAVGIELKQKIKKIENCDIYETFGMTETLSHFALRKLNYKGKSVPLFKVLPGVEIKVSKQQCLMVKTQTTDKKWIETKDVVEIVDSNLFQWKGRIDNVINSGGLKLFPEEIEAEISPILTKNGYKGEYYLTSQKDEKLGEKLVLVLEGLQKNENKLLDDLKKHLPKFHVPKKILYLKQLTRTESGKVKRIKI